MSKFSIIAADDNAEFIYSLKKYFQNDEQFEIIGTAENGLEALDLLQKTSADFLLLDIIMPELDGFGVLAELSSFADKPKVVVISRLAGDGFVAKAMRLGASYYFAKPISHSALRESLQDLCVPERDGVNPPLGYPLARAQERQFEQPRTRSKKTLEEKLSDIFITVGIPAHIKGYQFLRVAIRMTVENPEIINTITKGLYPSVAEHFDTSPSKVERAIRHAIDTAWSRGKIENINKVFGVEIYSRNDKPTNGEFIALVADKMLLEQ